MLQMVFGISTLKDVFVTIKSDVKQSISEYCDNTTHYQSSTTPHTNSILTCVKKISPQTPEIYV